MSTAQGNVDSVQTAAVFEPRRSRTETLLAELRRFVWIESTASARGALEGIVVRSSVNQDGTFGGGVVQQE